jgi:HAD superfamily hydrolase (TIGR01549 family)
MIMVKCVIFDVDGTLINTERAILLSLQQTVKEMTGKEHPLGDLTFAFGIPGKKALAALEVPDVDQAMSRWVERSYDYASDVQLFDGIEETLSTLKEKGRMAGIVTSQAKRELGILLDHFHIQPYFDHVITFDDTEKHKPDPDPLFAFLKKANLSAKDTIYIGDTPYDQLSAKSAGIPFGLALWGAKTTIPNADYVFNRPQELLDLF